LMIRVEQGKRRTDHSTILSPRLLTELDRYRAQRSLTRCPLIVVDSGSREGHDRSRICPV